MKKRVHAWVHTCDGCGAQHVQVSGEDLPLGIYGKFMWHHGAGGSGGDYYACSEACVIDAMQAVME